MTVWSGIVRYSNGNVTLRVGQVKSSYGRVECSSVTVTLGQVKFGDGKVVLYLVG